MGLKIGQSAGQEAQVVASGGAASSAKGKGAVGRGADPGAFAALLKEAPAREGGKEGALKEVPVSMEAPELAGEQDARLEGDYYGRAVAQGAVQRGEGGWGEAGVRAKNGGEAGDGGEVKEEEETKASGGLRGRGGGEDGEEVVGEEGFRPELGVGEVGEARSEEVGGGPAELGELVEAMVKAAQVGEDAQGRKVMFLELDVPGRGTLRVRLLKEHDGYAVRMRASDEGLARELLSRQSEMVRGAGARGVRLNAVEVVT